MSQDNDGWFYPKGLPEPETEEAAPSFAGASSAHVFDAATGEVRAVSDVGEVIINKAPGGASAGILSTARSAGFMSPTAQLTPDTLVEVDGSWTTLAAAEALQLVRRDESGKYVETSEAERTLQEQVPQEDEESKPEPFAATVEAELAELMKDAPAPIIGQMMVQAAMAVAETGVVSVNPEEVASRTGMPTERAALFIEKTEAALRNQAAAELKKADVDPEEFLAWAMQHKKTQLQEAFARHVTCRSLSGYRSLAAEFQRSVVPDADALQRGGWTVRINPDSTTSVKVGDVWYDSRVAARLGMI